ncbi:MAG TPA: TM2 domain-containing protein [Gemmatimonadales bacterium]|nr:TM2 domain-containing protein [Gemmatimonadales bacterium]
MTRIPPSEKSRSVALALAVVLGVFGGHRFYVGRTGSGLAMLCTLGGLGLWWLYDCIVVGAGQFTDAEGRRLTRWDPDIPEPWESIEAGSDPHVLAEVDALRAEVAELAERLDFAERLLGRGGGEARRES